MVVVGGEVVSTGTSCGGGGALDVPMSSLVLTGARGVEVVPVVTVRDDDDDDLAGVTGESRSGWGGNTDWCDVITTARTTASMAATPPTPATTIATVVSYHGVRGGIPVEPTRSSTSTSGMRLRILSTVERKARQRQRNQPDHSRQHR